MQEVEKERRPGFSEVGNTGLKRTGGMIFEEFLPALKGKRAIKVYDEMSSNDPIIGACLLAISQMVKQATWSVEPEDDSNEALRASEFVSSCMGDMEFSWHQFVSEALSMVTYGFSTFETVYKRRKGGSHNIVKGSRFNDGMIGWQNFSPRSQDSLYRWIFEDNGRVNGFIQHGWPDFQSRTIPGWKMILLRAGETKNNPEGRSALRNAYRPWFIKKGIEEIEAMGIERDLVGIPTAYVPAAFLSDDATVEEKATLSSVRDLLTNIRADKSNGIIIPSMFDENSNRIFDIQLMSSKGRRSHDTNAIINRKNKEIASSMLADFILIGHENVGSFALASSKTHLFSVAIGGYLQEIAGVLNRVEVPRLLRYNGMGDYPCPKIVHSDVETLELEDIAKLITALTDAGIDLTGEDIQGHLKDQAGIPHGDYGVIEDEEDDDQLQGE